VIGAHRGGVGNPLKAALKSARWIGALAALTVLPIALLGLVIYGMAIGTYLENLGLLGLVFVAWLVSAIVRRAAFDGWVAASLVLTTMSQIAGIGAHRPSWPAAGAMNVTHEATLVAGIACFGVATMIGARYCIRWWRRRHLARP